MNIQTASRLSGISAKAILRFELMGLVCPNQMKNGLRLYNRCDTEKLKFLKQAFRAGFSVEECRNLLALYFRGHRS